MARFAEIKNTISGTGQQPKSVYVNPLNVIAIEPIHSGTRIALNGGASYQTSETLNQVLAVIQEAML